MTAPITDSTALKSARLLSHFTKKEVDAAFKAASPVARRGPVLVLAAPAQKEYGRFLAIVPKKVGNAPKRNKIRRQIRAIFFEERMDQCGYDLIVLFRKGAQPLSFDELKALLLRAQERIVLLRAAQA